ncbi:hypothetical protein RS75_20395 [Rhizobium nepotum 39/7]|uniref:Uncharacterized protein n=1 Tax=Rhizobium nepotum 39/7 TaxID=1368418 RepID=A0ABR5CMH0_9HYPH|nr:hypothetical protein RS75_20395 [Rhizobium nepotum 39/7]
MPSHELPILVVHADRAEEGRLLVVRGANFWQVELWEGPWLLSSFDHTGARDSRDLFNLGKTAFFERPRTIAECVHGVDFDFKAGG